MTASPSFLKTSEVPGATIRWRPATRWPRWRAEYRVEPDALAKANQLKPGDGLGGVAALVVPVPTVASAYRAHTALHSAQGRHAGHHRRSFRRFAQPAAALEQSDRHQGPTGRRIRVAEPVVCAQHLKRASPQDFPIGNEDAIDGASARNQRVRSAATKTHRAQARHKTHSKKRHSTHQIENVRKKRCRDRITHLCFPGVCVQAITRMIFAGGMFVRLREDSIKSNAAASRWRQSDGRCGQACMQ